MSRFVPITVPIASHSTLFIFLVSMGSGACLYNRLNANHSINNSCDNMHCGPRAVFSCSMQNDIYTENKLMNGKCIECVRD